MQMIIHTEKDLQRLQGKFVLQVSSGEPDTTLMEYKWEFVKEKRLRLVSGLGFVDLYGERTTYDSFEKFKNIFNHYLFDHMIEKGETDGGRFHRLLSSKELDYLFQKMKEENY